MMAERRLEVAYRPHECGWVRVATDLYGNELWEKPDGTYHTFSAKQHKVVIKKQGSADD